MGVLARRALESVGLSGASWPWIPGNTQGLDWPETSFFAEKYRRRTANG